MEDQGLSKKQAQEVIRIASSLDNKMGAKLDGKFGAAMELKQSQGIVKELQDQMREMQLEMQNLKKALTEDAELFGSPENVASRKEIGEKWLSESSQLSTKLEVLNQAQAMNPDAYKELKDELDKLKTHVAKLANGMDNQDEFADYLMNSESFISGAAKKLDVVDRNLMTSIDLNSRLTIESLKKGAPQNYQEFIDKLHNAGAEEFIVPVPLANGRTINVDLLATPFTELPTAVKQHFQNGFGITSTNITMQRLDLSPISAQESWQMLIGDQVASQALSSEQTKLKYEQLPQSVKDALANDASPDEIRKLFEAEMQKQKQPMGATGSLMGLASKAIEAGWNTATAPFDYLLNKSDMNTALNKDRLDKWRNAEYAMAQKDFNRTVKEVDTQIRAMLQNPKYAELVAAYGQKAPAGDTVAAQAIEDGKKTAMTNFLEELKDPKAVEAFSLKPDALAANIATLSEKAERFQKAASKNPNLDADAQASPYNKALAKFEEWKGLTGGMVGLETVGADGTKKSLMDTMKEMQASIEAKLEALFEKIGEFFSNRFGGGQKPA